MKKRTPKELTQKEKDYIRDEQMLDQAYTFMSTDCPKHWRKLYVGLRKAKFDREQALRLLIAYIRCMFNLGEETQHEN
jgi:hypothetical protein